jgi:hypothetical protein
VSRFGFSFGYSLRRILKISWIFHGICSAWKILDLFLLECVGNQELSCYSAKDFFLHPKRGAFRPGKLMSG